MSAQLKQFLDQTGPLWMAGKLSDKAATSFTSAINRHGGQESTLLSFNNVFYHWGAVIVPPGYTDPSSTQREATPTAHLSSPGCKETGQDRKSSPPRATKADGSPR